MNKFEYQVYLDKVFESIIMNEKALSNNQAQTTLTREFLNVDICVCFVR